MDAKVCNTDIPLAAPKLKNYYEMNITMSNVPGLRSVIGNIPIGDVKVGLDSGFDLKYSDLMKNDLIINEFESIPRRKTALTSERSC